jgi:hypothetical protein
MIKIRSYGAPLPPLTPDDVSVEDREQPRAKPDVHGTDVDRSGDGNVPLNRDRGWAHRTRCRSASLSRLPGPLMTA